MLVVGRPSRGHKIFFTASPLGVIELIFNIQMNGNCVRNGS